MCGEPYGLVLCVMIWLDGGRKRDVERMKKSMKREM